jgi:hypothetical protein
MIHLVVIGDTTLTISLKKEATMPYNVESVDQSELIFDYAKECHKFSVVRLLLETLPPGQYKITDIIQAIKNIKNFKLELDTLKANSTFYKDYGNTCDLDELWVDITYQRKIRLKKLVTLLTDLKGYDPEVAGSIDVVIRPHYDQSGRKFVWDGLRRTIMYGLCGGKRMSVSCSRHDEDMTDIECTQKEATLFKIRNAFSEKMDVTEIFKSKVVEGDVKSNIQYDLLVEAGLDLEGMNPDGVKLGGFALFEKQWLKYDELGDLPEFKESIIAASKMIQKVWPTDETISVYLLSGLAYILRLNAEYVDYYTGQEIYDAFVSWRDSDPDKKKIQRTITEERLHGQAIPCIAFYIAKRILEDSNGLIKTIRQKLKDNGVTDDGMEFLEGSPALEHTVHAEAVV